jgi:hypothetical protein
MTQTLTRDLLYSNPVKEFEMTKRLGIRDASLEQIVKHCETVGTDDTLIASKVIDTVVRGAEEDENLWKKCANVTMMTTEIQRVPVITADDFALKPWIEGTRPRSSGGSFWATKLDCSQSAGLYATDIGFTKNDLRAGGIAKLEEALFCAGQAVGRLILQKINAKLLADKDAAMTDTLANWGNDHYKALAKMESLIAAQGMTPDVVLVNPTESYDIAVLDYFIRDDYSKVAGTFPRDIHSIGSLYGRIPINRHRDITTQSMIMLSSKKSIAIGLYRDITIDNYDDVREGLEGAIVSIQLDVKSGKDAEGPFGATNPVTKSWAVCTSA